MAQPKHREGLPTRPPIVAVLGHVDHGKTTLLDYIRQTNVAGREHGGITQHIGAYQIEVKSEKLKVKSEEKTLITFIDTPGHEAFAKMRSRGAKVADITILVVAADDSVKPQTKESIDQIKAAGIPLIVAANKIDLPTSNLDKVKADLAKVGVQVEGFGGEVPFSPISAKTGKGVPELLELILLVSEMKGLTSEPEASPSVVVIETRLDRGKGMVATVIVKKGILKLGLTLYDGAKVVARVRALFDENGQSVSTAGPSKPVEVLGFKELPPVGAILTSQPAAVSVTPKAESTKPLEPTAMPDFLKPLEETREEKLNIILKADTAGSLEAISASLPGKIVVVGSGIGEIAEADILFANTTGAIVVGFGVKCPAVVVKLSQTEKVIVRTYTIIYELLNELSEVASGLKEVLTRERELGIGTIIAEFPFEKQRIAGTKIASGRLARGDLVKVVRSENEIGRAKIKSLRHGKEDITKADAGIECGILLDRQVDFAIGDAIIAVTTG
ncbi:MAG: translation initiation factor IF-2 [Patescibacteria group bacterium]